MGTDTGVHAGVNVDLFMTCMVCMYVHTPHTLSYYTRGSCITWSIYLCVLEVVSPEWSDLVLTTNVPHCEIDVLVLHSLNIEPCTTQIRTCVHNEISCALEQLQYASLHLFTYMACVKGQLEESVNLQGICMRTLR